jgi:hypothetical protein
MNKKLILILSMSILLIGLVCAGNFLDLTQSDFDLGTYNNTFYNSSGFVQLNNSVSGQIVVNASEMIGNETGLISYWKFNESSWIGGIGEVKDVLGKNNGAAMSGANATTGMLGNAGNFSGIMGTYVNEVQVRDSPELNPGTESFTITGWARSIARGGNGYQLYVAKRDNLSGGKNGYYLGLLEGSGVKFVVGDGTNRVDTSYVNINYTNWFYFAAVINRATNQSLLYINGTLATSTSISSVGKINNSWNLSIGNDEGQALLGTTYQYPVKGKIDEVAIWNRSLSSSEILSLYNQGLQNITNSSNITSGFYESGVKDAGGIVLWKNISWNNLSLGLGLELPNNQQITERVDMSGNVLLYHLNEASGGIMDYSGNQNNGTQSGGVIYSVAGKYNSALGFEGVNDYIDCGNSNSVRILGNLTLSAWVNFNKIPSGTTVYSIIDKNEAGGYGIIANEATSGKLETYFYINGAYKKAGVDLSSLNAGTWYYVVGTYNGTSADLYLNGIKQQSVVATGSISDISYNLTIGANPGPTYAEFFNGSIDEVAVFNRSLSSSEILNIYNNQASNLRFQIRTSNTNPITSDYFGNDGSSLTYFTQPLNFSLSGRYFQYKTYFNDSSKLYNVSVEYTSFDSSDVMVNLDSPADNYLTNEYNVNVSCSASSTSELENITIYYDKFGWQALETKQVSGTTNSSEFILGELVSSVKWNCYSCNIDGNCSFADSNRTIIGDILSPEITLVSPANNFVQNLSLINFIFNSSDNRATNLSCGLIINNAEVARNSSVVLGLNTIFNYSLSNGDYTWKINCSDGINSGLSEERNLIMNVSSDYTPFWAKTNTHTHTTNSDGDSSPSVVVGLYKNKGYNILAITDHGYVTNCTPFTDSSFLCINSEEWTSVKHVVRINVSSAYNNNIANLQNAVDDVENNGGVAIAAHPNWSSTIWSVSELTSLQNYTAMEIYNHVIERLTPDPYAVVKWDSVLLTGKKIFGVASDDMHQVNVDLGYGFIKVYMPEFTIQSYLNSMNSGYFYSSQGPNMDSGPFLLNCDGLGTYRMGETANCSAISVNSTISATNSSFSVVNISLIRDGIVINSTICSSENCTLSYSESIANSGYYRIEAIDSGNKRIWSNPIWVNKIALPVILTINSPENNSLAYDYTPLVNISLNQNTSLWYSLNNQENITLCTNCSFFSGYLTLSDGENILRFYANNSDNIVRKNELYLNFNFNRTLTEDFFDNSSIASANKVFWNNGKMSMNSSNMFGNFVFKPILTNNNITSFSVEWLENNTENAKGDGQRVPIILKYSIGEGSWISLNSDGNYILNGSSVSGLNDKNLSIMLDFEKNSLTPVDLLNFKITWKEFTVPLMIGVSSGTPTTDSATITWTTDLNSNSSVFYGVSTSLGSVFSKSDSVTSHSISLTGLSSGTNYFYRVQSCTETSCSQDPQIGLYSFITQSASSGGDGGGSSSGGGGGGGGSYIIGNKTGKLQVSSVGNIIAREGDNKKIPLVIKNTGSIFLNRCKLIASGEIEAWIYSNQIKGLAPGESLDFVFDLNVPEGLNLTNYNGVLNLRCDEAESSQEISISIPSLKELTLGEIRQDGKNLIVNYVFDSSEFDEEEAILEIWISNEAGDKLKKIQDKIELNGDNLINREVIFDVSDLSGVYYINCAFSSNLKEFIRSSIIIGKSSSTGFAILDQTLNKNIVYVIFILIIVVGVFLIWKKSDKKEKSNHFKSSESKWLLRKKAVMGAVFFIFLIVIIGINKNLSGLAISDYGFVTKSIIGAVVFIFAIGIVFLVLQKRNSPELFVGKHPYLTNLSKKLVYTKEGEVLGRVEDIALKECKIESIKIKFNARARKKFKKKGIVIKYNVVDKVGEIIILKKFNHLETN